MENISRKYIQKRVTKQWVMCVKIFSATSKFPMQKAQEYSCQILRDQRVFSQISSCCPLRLDNCQRPLCEFCPQLSTFSCLQEPAGYKSRHKNVFQGSVGGSSGLPSPRKFYFSLSSWSGQTLRLRSVPETEDDPPV